MSKTIKNLNRILGKKHLKTIQKQRKNKLTQKHGAGEKEHRGNQLTVKCLLILAVIYTTVKYDIYEMT